MRILFDGDVETGYSQMYVEDGGGDWVPDPTTCFGGQDNGLCGAAVEGGLFLTTGMHTGAVPVVVEEHDVEPPVPDGWDEVVEVPFVVPPTVLMILGWGGGSSHVLPLRPGQCRVRYCASDMDAARTADCRQAGEPPVDRYLLQFWPAPHAADAVLRQTSSTAAYWHGVARDQPPPPTAEERAAAQRAAAERERERAVERDIAVNWGGRAPSDRLQELGGSVRRIARTDRDLLDDLEALGPVAQRATACWLARRAFEIAGIDTTDWGRAALEAMDRGDPLPFTDRDEAVALAQADLTGPRVSHATLVGFSFSAEVPRLRHIHRPSFALPALFSAVGEDPLLALVDTFSHAAATFNEQREELVEELRARCADTSVQELFD